MTHTVQCVKLEKEAEGLPAAPLPGELGQKIYENVSREAWQDWLTHQTRLINEYHLALADPKAREFLTNECEKYFFGGGELASTHYTPPDEDQAQEGDSNAADQDQSES